MRQALFFDCKSYTQNNIHSGLPLSKGAWKLFLVAGGMLDFYCSQIEFYFSIA